MILLSGRQMTDVTCLNSIRRLRTGLGCTFEFSIRRKPFRLKVNRSNAVSSRTGAIDRDRSGFEAISRQRYGK